MSIRFIIEDEAHSEWCGEYSTFAEAMVELERRRALPWDHPPNVAPCESWRICGRNYEIVEFNVSTQPWQELRRTPALAINSRGSVWAAALAPGGT